jgi:phosphatidylethanolamine-binding protein (PEBP) family uncharacterized protein
MQPNVLRGAVFAAAFAAAAPLAQAQEIPKTVFDIVAEHVTTMLDLTSTDIKAGEPIDVDYTGYGANKSPALTWNAGPAGTGAYVVVLQDPIAGRPAPNQHWIIYNIPAGVTALPQAGRRQGGGAH